MNERASLPASRMQTTLFAAVLLIAPLVSSASSEADETAQLAFSNVDYMLAATWRAETTADHRILYGNDGSPVQFGDLRIPEGEGPDEGFPIIVFIHGGAWRAQWSKDYSEALVEKLVEHGFATWDLEFRRLGHRGGGYPGTFEDAADGLDYLRALAEEFPLDLSRVIAVGHSSGGHLAMWLAGRHQLDATSPLYRADPLPLSGVISIAGVNDLGLSLTLGNRTDVLTLAGIEAMDSGWDRLGEVDPARLLPFGVSQVQVIGDMDSEWRLEMHERYQARARELGDAVDTIILPGANHMDVVDAQSGVATLLASIIRERLLTDPE